MVEKTKFISRINDLSNKIDALGTTTRHLTEKAKTRGVTSSEVETHMKKFHVLFDEHLKQMENVGISSQQAFQFFIREIVFTYFSKRFLQIWLNIKKMREASTIDDLIKAMVNSEFF